MAAISSQFPVTPRAKVPLFSSLLPFLNFLISPPSPTSLHYSVLFLHGLLPHTLTSISSLSPKVFLPCFTSYCSCPSLRRRRRSCCANSVPSSGSTRRRSSTHAASTSTAPPLSLLHLQNFLFSSDSFKVRISVQVFPFLARLFSI